MPAKAVSLWKTVDKIKYSTLGSKVVKEEDLVYQNKYTSILGGKGEHGKCVAYYLF